MKFDTEGELIFYICSKYEAQTNFMNFLRNG